MFFIQKSKFAESRGANQSISQFTTTMEVAVEFNHSGFSEGSEW